MTIAPRTGRRGFLVGAASAAASLALYDGLATLAVAGAASLAILKPTPSQWFTDFGTNAEMRWDSVRAQDYRTRPARLFVRNHTRTPSIDAATYSLRVFGDGVAGERTFTLAQLKALPNVERTTVLECTGNGRSFFASQQGRAASGTQWTLGAVGTVQWQGVLLRDVLAAVGLRPEAVSIQATGLDPSYVTGGTDYGPVRRPFPVAKALDDALLAWGMDGEALLPDHGYPLRLVLPGWVGIGSIKWLGSLEVATTELTSPWNTQWYRMTGGDHPVDSPPLTVNPVRSAWELPWGARLEAAPTLTLTGRSWSGAGAISRIEVSIDGGTTWRPTRVRRNGQRAGWTQWEFAWAAPQPGDHVLMARATDVEGRTQPLVTPYNDNGYFFDAVVKHPVTVAA